MNQISSQELKTKIDNNEDIELIDLREIYEYEDYHIKGSKHVPLGEVMNNLDKIDTSKIVIFYCNSGKKSRAIIIALSKKINTDNIFSLEGGITNYYTEIEA